jgi:nucleoside-diphosphate-sugar epimerase
MKVSIIGLGWYGSPLGMALHNDGYEVLGTTRSSEKVEMFKAKNILAYSLTYPETPEDRLLQSDVIILNIPPFDEELAWFKKWKWKTKSWIIFISSTSRSPKLLEQEEWVKENFSHWTVIRFGGLIGGGRHPAKHLSGRTDIKGRRWPVNLIHQNDTIEFTKIVLNQKLTGKTFHLVSPEHPTREEYYSRICEERGLPLPRFDKADESHGKLVSNEDVLPYFTSFTCLSNP